MITVHHLNNSRSQRVLWLLEELGVPYEIKFYQRDAKTMLAPPELRAIHPLGKSPVITDTGTTVAESGAIMDFLINRYGNGRFAPPTGTPERLRYNYWMHYAEGSLMPLMVMTLVFNQIPKGPMPFFVKPVARGIASKVKSVFLGPQIKLHLDYLEAELGQSEWFAGNELSAADIQMSFPVEAAAARASMGQRYPRLSAWLERVHARPAYQRALKKGGPFALAS
jgi:glutathione S-transferase